MRNRITYSYIASLALAATWSCIGTTTACAAYSEQWLNYVEIGRAKSAQLASEAAPRKPAKAVAGTVPKAVAASVQKKAHAPAKGSDDPIAAFARPARSGGDKSSTQ
jgi:hypothetical protein